MKNNYFRLSDHKLPWLLIYISANIIAAFIILRDGYLIGDVAGIKLYSVNILILSLLLVLAAYYVIMVPAFKLITHYKFKAVNFGLNDDLVGARIGKLFVILQILFAIFNIVNGVNIAGASLTNKTDSPFSFIWVLIPIDTLFIIYYAYYRENKLFKLNLIIWIISQLSRGWMGGIMTVIFLEWCRLARRKTLNKTKIGLAFLIVVLIYPFLTEFKWIVRANAANILSFDVVISAISGLFSENSFFDVLQGGLEHFISRIQFVSLTVEVVRLMDVLQDAFSAGKFSPFWMEGLHGLIYDKLINGEKSVLVSVAFTQYEYFPGKIFDVGSYNISLGFLSWFFIAPLFIPLYLIYTLFLGISSHYLVRKIGASQLSEDMLWFYWLGLLLAGWLFVFITFIQSLMIFFALKIIFSRKFVRDDLHSSFSGSANL